MHRYTGEVPGIARKQRHQAYSLILITLAMQRASSIFIYSPL